MEIRFMNVNLFVLIIAFASSQARVYRCNFDGSRCWFVPNTITTRRNSSASETVNTNDEHSTTMMYPQTTAYTYMSLFTSRNRNLRSDTSLSRTNLTEMLNISTLEEAIGVLNNLDTLDLPENESLKAVNKAIETLSATLKQSQPSNIDNQDLIKIFDIAAIYVEYMDENETETFLDVSSKALISYLNESDSATQAKDVILKVEEYTVSSSSDLLKTNQQNALSMSLGALQVTFCKSGTDECSFETENVEFETVEQSNLVVTFIEYTGLDKDLLPVDSVVASATARNSSRNKVSIPVTFTLKHNQAKESESSSTCVFLNVTTEQWSTDGCDVIDANATHTKCLCDHTTNFAILFLHSAVGITKEDEFWFNLMTYVGCGVSITSLIATMSIFVILRLHHAERIIILWNLCFCLCSAQLILVAGTTAQVGTTGCQVIAILLHFFFTASFSWMLVEGVHLYMKASNARGGKYKFKMLLVSGWTLPICIVSISMGIGLDQYGSGNACWLSIENGFIWAFIGPALGIIAVNSIVLIFVIKVFLGLKSISKTSERERIKKATKAVLFLMPLLGITWIFGLLAFDGSTKWFLYLFCICNSLQGLAIFILQCAKNDDVRKAFFKKYRRTFVSIGSYSSGASGSSNKTNDSYMSTDHPTRGLPTIAKW